MAEQLATAEEKRGKGDLARAAAQRRDLDDRVARYASLRMRSAGAKLRSGLSRPSRRDLRRRGRSRAARPRLRRAVRADGDGLRARARRLGDPPPGASRGRAALARVFLLVEGEVEVVAVRLDVERPVGERLRRERVEEDRCAAVGDDLVALLGAVGDRELELDAVAVVRPADAQARRGSRLRFLEHPLDRFCSLLRQDEQRNLPLSSAVLRVHPRPARHTARYSTKGWSRAQGECARLRYRRTSRTSGAGDRASSIACSSCDRRNGFMTWPRRLRAVASRSSERRCSRRGSAAAGAGAASDGQAAPPRATPAPAASDRAPLPRPARAGRSVCDRAAGPGARAATGSPDLDPRSGWSPR